jgi:hypothetical protein
MMKKRNKMIGALFLIGLILYFLFKFLTPSPISSNLRQTEDFIQKPTR